jgi:ADP-ribose pyrophosphatase
VSAGARLRSIEVVEDRTATSRCDEGFLQVQRLLLRNHYEDGSASATYPCDVLSRKGSDAVVAVLYEIDGARRVRVVLRDAPRAPVYLRARKTFVHPDPRTYLSLMELVAGMVEPEDSSGDVGLCRRAALEAKEEAGLEAPAEDFAVLGGGSFSSPGGTDEKLYFCAAPVEAEEATPGRGDGSVMEECAKLVVLELSDAIAACRSGAIPDMKTEIGLLRLADHLGYLPQLGCFVDELPPELAARHTPLGVSSGSARGERSHHPPR